jgi:uncharacterized OsmC-like protein
MEQVIKTVNGVDLNQLVGTINAVSTNPELAHFQFRAANEWIDGGFNRSTIKSFYGAGQEDSSRTEPFILENDEPNVLLGGNHAANPVEQVLHGLAGCLTTSMVYHSAARGYRIDKVESRLEGDLNLKGFLGLDGNVRNGFENIKVSFSIEGDLTREQKEEILKLGMKFSPVFDIVTNTVPVKVTLVAN